MAGRALEQCHAGRAFAGGGLRHRGLPAAGLLEQIIPAVGQNTAEDGPGLQIEQSQAQSAYTACAIGAFLLLDCCLDPLLERAFPKSEAAYQEALEAPSFSRDA